jgi:hypothetical protein
MKTKFVRCHMSEDEGDPIYHQKRRARSIIPIKTQLKEDDIRRLKKSKIEY